MNRNTKKKLIILKTLSLQESFFVVIKDYISKQDIIFNHNELDDFNKFIKDVKYVVGFDIKKDLDILALWIAGGRPEAMYQYKKNLENGGKIDYSKKYDFFAIDLKYLHRLHKKNLSLKYIGANLNIDQLYQKIPDQYDKKYIEYNVHSTLIDVNIISNMLEYSIGMIKSRKELSKIFKLYLLDNSASRIADKILKKEIFLQDHIKINEEAQMSLTKSYDNELKKSIQIKDIIDIRIYFDNDKLNRFLDKIKDLNLSENYENTININELNYKFGSGGLHSIDKPNIYESTKDYLYVNIDASSYYATLAKELKISPKNINSKTFHYIIEKLLNLRKENLNDPDQSKLYKDILTSIIGKFISINSWIYDPFSYYKITINGQLIMLMLISLLEENNFHVVYCNTDELLIKIKSNDFEKLKELINSFCRTNTNILFKINICNKFILKESNNTLRVFSDGIIKRNGFFDYDLWITKKLNAPIIAKAIEQILLYNVDIDDFFNKNRNIYDYCFSLNVTKDQVVKVSGVVNKKIIIDNLDYDFIRYFISNKNGLSLRLYSDNKETIITKDKAQIINNIYLQEEYDVDVNYYKKEVIKVLDLFKIKQLELF